MTWLWFERCCLEIIGAHMFIVSSSVVCFHKNGKISLLIAHAWCLLCMPGAWDEAIKPTSGLLAFVFNNVNCLLMLTCMLEVEVIKSRKNISLNDDDSLYGANLQVHWCISFSDEIPRPYQIELHVEVVHVHKCTRRTGHVPVSMYIHVICEISLSEFSGRELEFPQ